MGTIQHIYYTILSSTNISNPYCVYIFYILYILYHIYYSHIQYIYDIYSTVYTLYSIHPSPHIVIPKTIRGQSSSLYKMMIPMQLKVIVMMKMMMIVVMMTVL